MFRLLLVCGLFLGLSLGGFPQVSAPADSAVLLPVAEVVGAPLRAELPGAREERWGGDALRSQGNIHLGELLEQESGVFVKNYGPGSSATTSIRGGSAGHTSVLWNGLPLQSVMLGQLDFSLLPVTFVDEIRVQYGGNAAAWGSGAIGGVIELDNRPGFGEKAAATAGTTFGSFGFREQQIAAHYGRGKWRADTRFFHRQADNDFPYQLRPDLPEKRMVNAALRQAGLLQSVHWRPGPRQQFGLHIWGQRADREIPPTTVQNISEAFQADEFLRTALQWKYVQKKVVWQARAGLFREHLEFRDDQLLQYAVNRFWTATAEVEGEWFISDRQRLHFGLGHTWLQADADAYEEPPRQNRTAPFLAFRQQWGEWRAQINLRQEIIDGRLAPFLPGIGLDGPLTGWLTVHAKLTRNYRLPTFNDLYWRPGGNPDLRPESGWSREATLRAHGAPGRHRWSYSLTGFSRRIDDWILWGLLEGQSYWSAANLTRVRSRGLEQRLQWAFETPGWRCQLQGGYDYIRSTNEVAVERPRLAAGEQLIYVPRHRAFGRLLLQWKGLEGTYRHTFTGPVGALNQDELPGYNLGFLSLSGELAGDHWRARLFLQLNNVWNADYRIVERRPMPGRHWRLGLEVSWLGS